MTQFPVIFIELGIFRSLMTLSGHAYLHRQWGPMDVLKDFGYGPCTDSTEQGNDFELILMVK